MKHAFFLAGLIFLAGCAVTPLQTLPPTHPASPQAPEASHRSPSNLTADEATTATQQLLGGGTSVQPEKESMSSMPGMNH